MAALSRAQEILRSYTEGETLYDAFRRSSDAPQHYYNGDSLTMQAISRNPTTKPQQHHQHPKNTQENPIAHEEDNISTSHPESSRKSAASSWIPPEQLLSPDRHASTEYLEFLALREKNRQQGGEEQTSESSSRIGWVMFAANDLLTKNKINKNHFEEEGGRKRTTEELRQPYGSKEKRNYQEREKRKKRIQELLAEVKQDEPMLWLVPDGNRRRLVLPPPKQEEMHVHPEGEVLHRNRQKENEETEARRGSFPQEYQEGGVQDDDEGLGFISSSKGRPKTPPLSGSNNSFAFPQAQKPNPPPSPIEHVAASQDVSTYSSFHFEGESIEEDFHQKQRDDDLLGEQLWKALRHE